MNYCVQYKMYFKDYWNLYVAIKQIIHLLTFRLYFINIFGVIKKKRNELL